MFYQLYDSDQYVNFAFKEMVGQPLSLLSDISLTNRKRY